MLPTGAGAKYLMFPPTVLKVVVAGEDNRLGARPHAELVEDVRGVVADRLLADAQPLGDVIVAQPFGHQRQHLPLAG